MGALSWHRRCCGVPRDRSLWVSRITGYRPTGTEAGSWSQLGTWNSMAGRNFCGADGEAEAQRREEAFPETHSSAGAQV